MIVVGVTGVDQAGSTPSTRQRSTHRRRAEVSHAVPIRSRHRRWPMHPSVTPPRALTAVDRGGDLPPGRPFATTINNELAAGRPHRAELAHTRDRRAPLGPTNNKRARRPASNPPTCNRRAWIGARSSSSPATNDDGRPDRPPSQTSRGRRATRSTTVSDLTWTVVDPPW